MILVVQADQVEALMALLTSAGEKVSRIGTVTQGEGMRYSGSLL
jgi:phosphoribosylformylglycinamidine cyclo-ligase